MWNEPWQENLFWVSGQGRTSTSVEWQQVVAREKTKFKMKIMRGKKVKWCKRREGQNMWIEIKCSKKSRYLICTDLLDKKWMLKSYAGKKISQIMEKTTVDFILVACNIFHCFFFLDPLLVMSDVDPIWPYAVSLRLLGMYCLWLSPSVVNLVSLHSAVRLKHYSTGHSPSWW